MNPLIGRLLYGSSTSIFFLLLIAYLPHSPIPWIFTASLMGAGTCCLWEYFKLSKNSKMDSGELISFVSLNLYLLLVFLHQELLAEGTLIISCLGIALTRFNQPKKAQMVIATTFFGLLYIAYPFGALLKLAFYTPQAMHLDPRIWLLFLICSTSLPDAGAYIVGRNLGGKKLCPKVSPKKTVSGATASFLISLGVALAFWMAVDLHLSATSFLLLSIVIAIASQLGDLVESLLKRDAGVKDSGNIPGLGGCLDIFDSLLLTAPILYLFLTYAG